MIAAFVLYAILISLIIRALRPMVYHRPIPPDWDGIEQHYFGKDEGAALSLLISTYIDSLDKNDVQLNYKANAIRMASILLMVIVIVLLGMGILGLSGNATWPWQSSPLPLASSLGFQINPPLATSLALKAAGGAGASGPRIRQAYYSHPPP